LCDTLPLQDSRYSTGRTKSNHIKNNHIKKEQKPGILNTTRVKELKHHGINQKAVEFFMTLKIQKKKSAKDTIFSKIKCRR